MELSSNFHLIQYIRFFVPHYLRTRCANTISAVQHKSNSFTSLIKKEEQYSNKQGLLPLPVDHHELISTVLIRSIYFFHMDMRALCLHSSFQYFNVIACSDCFDMMDSFQAPSR